MADLRSRLPLLPGVGNASVYTIIMKREVVTWSCAARTRGVFLEKLRFEDARILYARRYLCPVAIPNACEFKVPSPGQISITALSWSISSNSGGNSHTRCELGGPVRWGLSERLGESFALSVLTCALLSFAQLESFDTVSPSRFETTNINNNFQLLLVSVTLHLGRSSVSTSFATGSG